MQSTKKVTEEVLWRWPVARFRNGIQYEYKKQLKAVCNQYLFLVSEYHMVVWYTPCGGVVLQRLRGLAFWYTYMWHTYCVQEGA